MFKAQYDSLGTGAPTWGEVALLPWDSDIFGFAVADYRIGDWREVATNRSRFQEALAQWATVNKVELIACSAPADDSRWCALLQDLGFDFVDYTLEVSNRHIQSLKIPAARNPVRPATLEDQAEVERVAETAFRFGRYHADPRFPRTLADLRYGRWLHNAFASLGPDSIIYVTGETDRITGFLHVNLRGTDAYITIAGVEKSVQGGIIGYDLIAASISSLKDAGIRKITTKVSAVNTAIVNIVISFDGRFAPAQAVFHWHAPDAPHLLPRESIYV